MEEFGFVFTAHGNLGSKLGSMSNAFDSASQSLKRTNKEAVKTGSSLGSALDTGTAGFHAMSSAAGSFSLVMSGVLTAVATMGRLAERWLIDPAKAMISRAAEIESANARLGFSLQKIGLDYDNTVRKIDEISLATRLTRNELTNMVSDLAVQKINLFAGAANNLGVTLADGSRATITAAEAIDDAVSFSGKNMRRVMMSIKETVSEGKIRVGRWLSDDLNLARKEVTLWNKELAKTTDQQETFNVLLGLIAGRVGGATKSVAGTLAFINQQTGDWIDKLSNELAKDALPVIRDLMRDIGKWVLFITKDDRMKPFRDAFTEVVEVVIAFGRKGFEYFKVLVDFLGKNPVILKWVAYFGLAIIVATKLALVASAILLPILAIGGALIAIPLAIATIKAGLIAVGSILLPIIAPVLAIGAALTLIAALTARIGLGGKDWADTWAKVKMFVVGVAEGIANMTGASTSFSLKTAKSLEQHGLFDKVWNLLRLLFRVKMMFTAAWTVVKEAWPKISAMVQRISDRIVSNYRKVGEAYGIVNEEGKTGVESQVQAWIHFGVIAAKVVLAIVFGILTIIDAGTRAQAVMADLVKSLSEVFKSKFFQAYIKYAPGLFAARQVYAAAGGDEGGEVTPKSEFARGIPYAQPLPVFQTRGASPELAKTFSAATPTEQMNLAEAITFLRTDQGKALEKALRNSADYLGVAIARHRPDTAVTLDGRVVTDIVGDQVTTDQELGQ